MSQVIAPIRHHWIVALSALLALLATTAVVLVLAIDGGSSDSVALQSGPALRADGGPDESAVASAIATPQTESAYPAESRIAAAIASH
jgi:hypothetical protein